jgi:hypothetical protein
MDAAAVATAGGRTDDCDARAVPSIFGLSALADFGLFGRIYRLLRFRGLHFASVAPPAIGATLPFPRATGPEHA